MFFGMELWSSIWWLEVLTTLIIIYLGRKKPARSTMMWVMVQAVLPLVGFGLYLLIGTDTRKKRMFRLKSTQDKMIRELCSAQVNRISEGGGFFLGEGSHDHNEMVAINIHNDQNALFVHNAVDVIFDGKEKFRRLIDDIDAAQSSVDIQYYIFKSDPLGRLMIEHLIARAEAGIKVRVLVDSFGGRKLRERDITRMREAGIKFAVFFEAIFKHLNLRLNYRNHRKLVIIDDRIGYIGGFNVGNEYISMDKKFGYWRDTHLRIDGDAVAALQLRFLQDWLYASGEDAEMEQEVLVHPHETETTSLQLVTSGPDTLHPNIKMAMLKMISAANRSIIIQTPYLVPDQSIMDALMLALSQGVDVQIMIPCKPDHPVVYWATTSYAGELIRNGARVYRYEKGFLHAKVMIVDDFVSMIGSANVDERSFTLNFEASEMVYSHEINRKLRVQFDKDIKESTLITTEMYNNRPLLQKIKEPIARLGSPLL